MSPETVSQVVAINIVCFITRFHKLPNSLARRFLSWRMRVFQYELEESSEYYSVKTKYLRISKEHHFPYHESDVKRYGHLWVKIKNSNSHKLRISLRCGCKLYIWLQNSHLVAYFTSGCKLCIGLQTSRSDCKPRFDCKFCSGFKLPSESKLRSVCKLRFGCKVFSLRLQTFFLLELPIPHPSVNKQLFICFLQRV